ncbi:uncharacterized protein BJ212DRAFT_1486660 [Suillus subaureus]|uniref:Uncharacterized protein n=1 Tax=Suillus subaureus TaxID=48587 RepID=A0A9P7DW96_9AGAM|nr:uncharacterized protein BJ212DRAFT_1486660 [Suillus subaureus]KAG1804540.1 hypothetical protein BJ212DRAFT_1486660 [Suillus subaureus]
MDHQDSDGAASHHAPVQPQIPQPGPSSEVSHEAPHQPHLTDSCSCDPHNPPQNPPEPVQCTPHVPLTCNLPDRLTDPHSHNPSQSLSNESMQNPPEPVQHAPRVPLTHDLPEQLQLESCELSHEPIIHTGGWYEPTECGYDTRNICDPLDTCNFHCPHDPIHYHHCEYVCDTSPWDCDACDTFYHQGGHPQDNFHPANFHDSHIREHDHTHPVYPSRYSPIPDHMYAHEVKEHQWLPHYHDNMGRTRGYLDRQGPWRRYQDPCDNHLSQSYPPSPNAHPAPPLS